MAAEKDSTGGGRKQWVRFFLLPFAAAIIAAIGMYFAVSAYVLNQADENIQNILLSHKAIHHYIQRVMHPAFYRARDAGEISQSFYSPEILSSSYIVRVMHAFDNEERIKAGLPAVYYKLASDNPRNPVNRADKFESDLIRLFNERKDLKEYRSVIKVDGKRYLFVAIPFLETNNACTRCHGNRSDAPSGLQALYSGSGGFNERVGRVRAIESIRAPIDQDFFLIAIVTTFLAAFVFAGLALYLFNRHLSGKVADRTTALQDEIATRLTVERQLLQAQRLESVGRLAGGVAHDFNNFLTVIIGHAEIGLMDLDSNQVVHANLEEIRKAAGRSAELTRQLLAFARKQTVSPQVINLNNTVADMLKMLQRLIGESIHLTWRPTEQLWPVNMDPAQVDQILANLCVNARDAIRDVGEVVIETGNITVDADYCAAHPDAAPGDYLLLSVSDDGHGMDRETVSHIFEPFFTTKEVSKGTGLGLATVYGIVRQNNGFINVYSEPGVGTTFTIYLPRYGGNYVASSMVAAEPNPRGSETILLVEDDQAVLKLATAMLEGLGYTVVAAGGPGEAVRLAHEHAGQIQLLLADVIMPEMNGWDLAKGLQAEYPGLRLLFMSGYTADSIAQFGVLDSASHYIQKPFSLQDLATKVRGVLDN
ncbi:blue-light-activated protein [Geobacter sp. OR-1]|uniref:c-type heme family protein n=1 Tax=Geobacter sp. OR-1 TaxID=1266765 RepID=UPI000541FE39|nr:DUF3365 domain-containing protein [Geobacter sp. OR-1]GAM09577.1 blue-light-activated protein [Geobacter sp. OR-1]